VSYRILTGHGAPAPTIPKPEVSPLPSVLTVQDGLPVIYGDTAPTCGIRVVHPSNPKAPSKNHSVVILYVPPQGEMELHSHETEETYSVLSGRGVLLYRGGQQEIGPGHHIYLPSWCEHGIVNTGTEVLVALLSTSPPNP
jgi:mannose-6-phosphate isomerase-like protein (cupin superfamily)